MFAYGTLMPGKSNAHQLSGIEGQWQKGWARGRFFPSAWGEAVGFPGIILDEHGQRIQGMLLSSGDLPAHWNRLDAFEGEGYVRVITRVTLADGSRVRAHIYELAEKISPDNEAPIIRPARDTDRSAIARLHALSWQIAYAPVLPASFLKSRVFENRLEKWQTWEILPEDLVLVAEARHPEGGDRQFVGIYCGLVPAGSLYRQPSCPPRLHSQGSGHRSDAGRCPGACLQGACQGLVVGGKIQYPGHPVL